MKVSDLLTQFGVLMQETFHGGLPYSWKHICFMRDALGYICGRRPKYGLYDYLDDEGDAFWNDLQGESCDICWADADKGPYGFQAREQYAYLPCYDKFLTDMACKLYGSPDASFQKKIKKEIKSLGFWNGKESLDLDNQLMDNGLVKAILSTYPDFFQFADKREDSFRGLIRLFFDVVWLDEMEMGIEEWKLLKVESPALNAWLGFLYGDAVSDQDRSGSMQILSTLINTPATLETMNDEICFISHGPSSPCFERPCGGTGYTSFSLVVMQNGFGNCNYGYEEGLFWFGLLNPHFLSAMHNVKDFLEKMDGKYHYFSSGNHQAAAGGEAEEGYCHIDGPEAGGGHNGNKNDESAIFL